MPLFSKPFTFQSNKSAADEKKPPSKGFQVFPLFDRLASNTASITYVQFSESHVDEFLNLDDTLSTSSFSRSALYCDFIFKTLESNTVVTEFRFYNFAFDQQSIATLTRLLQRNQNIRKLSFQSFSEASREVPLLFLENVEWDKLEFDDFSHAEIDFSCISCRELHLNLDVPAISENAWTGRVESAIACCKERLFASLRRTQRSRHEQTLEKLFALLQTDKLYDLRFPSWITSCRYTGAFLRSVGHLKRLDVEMAWLDQLDEGDIAALGALTSLEALSLRTQTSVPTPALVFVQALVHMTHLRSLRMTFGNWDHDSLALMDEIVNRPKNRHAGLRELSLACIVATASSACTDSPPRWFAAQQSMDLFEHARGRDLIVGSTILRTLRLCGEVSDYFIDDLCAQNKSLHEVDLKMRESVVLACRFLLTSCAARNRQQANIDKLILRQRWSSWQHVHRRLVEICIALANFNIPSYVLLEIVDCIQRCRQHQRGDKIQVLISTKKSIEKVWAARNDDSPHLNDEAKTTMVNASQALRTISTFAGLDSDAVLNPHSTGFFQEKKFSFDLNSKTSRSSALEKLRGQSAPLLEGFSSEISRQRREEQMHRFGHVVTQHVPFPFPLPAHTDDDMAEGPRKKQAKPVDSSIAAAFQELSKKKKK